MKILLDRQASTPLYVQIHDRFKHLIQSGILQADQQLPSIRSLAETMGCAPFRLPGKFTQATTGWMRSRKEAIAALVFQEYRLGFSVRSPSIRAMVIRRSSAASKVRELVAS